ncbi:MAG: hypothetical protein ABJ314_22450, partial [Ilumatobacter sp.]
FVRSIERRIADGGVLLPGGMPTSWHGSNFEVHGVPTSATSTVSFAVRWHGERPAVLWEQHSTNGSTTVELSAPDVDPEWRTSDATGEALWPAPERVRARPGLSITVDGNSDAHGDGDPAAGTTPGATPGADPDPDADGVSFS